MFGFVYLVFGDQYFVFGMEYLIFRSGQCILYFGGCFDIYEICKFSKFCFRQVISWPPVTRAAHRIAPVNFSLLKMMWMNKLFSEQSFPAALLKIFSDQQLECAISCKAAPIPDFSLRIFLDCAENRLNLSSTWQDKVCPGKSLLLWMHL